MLSETIKNTTKEHLLNGGFLYGQCLTAVGWVAGTIPDDLPQNKGLMELPTSDSSNGGIVCGAALMGKCPIYVIRYQGFTWYNAVSLVNYAAKSKELWDQPCPVFIRAIGMEGGIGPVAGGMNHGMIARMPGIKVYAPCNSREWLETWNEFISGDDPVYCSENRPSFKLEHETDISNCEYPEVTVLAIGIARINAKEAVEELKGKRINLFGVHKLKPLEISDECTNSILKSNYCIVLDSDYTTCGMSEHIAYKIMAKFKVPTIALGLEDRTAGFSPETDIKTPSKEIIKKYVEDLLY